MLVKQVHYYGGQIFVRTETGTYGDTLENFARDYGADAPRLPEGLTERIYEPKKRHALIRNHDVIDGGPLPWPDGDKMLSAIGRLIAAQRSRLEKLEQTREAVMELNRIDSMNG